jgi:hypothetical protein
MDESLLACLSALNNTCQLVDSVTLALNDFQLSSRKQFEPPGYQNGDPPNFPPLKALSSIHELPDDIINLVIDHFDSSPTIPDFLSWRALETLKTLRL